jgi:nucleoid-associated protein YgaU
MDERLDAELARLIGPIAALVAVAAGVAVLLALVAEGARALGRAPRFVHAVTAVTPGAVRRLAVLALSVAVSLPHPTAALGATPDTTTTVGPVRRWLGTATAPAASPEAPPTTTATAPPTSSSPLSRPALTPTSGASPPVVVVTPARPPPPPPTAPPPTAPSQPAPPAAADRYVVRAGDCLWRIAANRLGGRPTNRAIDLEWRRIYRANRAVIGPDPNLIHPGTALSLPPAAA